MQQTIVEIEYNAIDAKIISKEDDAVSDLIRNMLSYEVDGGYGGYNSRSTFFNWQAQSFPSGFVMGVWYRLTQKGYEVKLYRNALCKPLGLPNMPINDFPPNPDYDYQDETVEIMVEKGSIISHLATGGGKSVVAAKAFQRIGRLTLFLTTRGILMHQMKKTFDESLRYRKRNHGLDKNSFCGVIGDGIFKPSKTLNVATVQSISAILEPPARSWDKKKKEEHLKKQSIVKQILKHTRLLIMEEAHEASGQQFFDICRLCEKADYRLALTATPFMRDQEANLRLMAVSGKIGIRVTEEELINKGILATPYFKYVPTDYEPDVERIKADLIDPNQPKFVQEIQMQLKKNSQYQKAQQLGITYNLKRNRQIVAECMELVSKGNTMIVLIKNKKHGAILKEMLVEQGIKTKFIFGESKQEERDHCLQLLGDRKIDVLIGSTILDVGVDCPSVNAVILAGGGKAEVALRQRIGRGLRRKKTGENVTYIVDFIDKHNNYLKRHSMERRKVVEETKGFFEGILMPNITSFFQYPLKSRGK